MLCFKANTKQAYDNCLYIHTDDEYIPKRNLLNKPMALFAHSSLISKYFKNHRYAA